MQCFLFPHLNRVGLGLAMACLATAPARADGEPFKVDARGHDPEVLAHYRANADFFRLGKLADLPEGLKWEDGSGEQEFSAPDAKRGGTYQGSMGDFPRTLRCVGPDANGAFRSHILDHNAVTLVMSHPNTDGYYPGLARQWAVSADRRTVFFRLDPDARWSDGKPVRATDFFYHFYFMRSPHIKAPWYNDYYSIDKFKSITLYDARTLALTYWKVSPEILDKLNIRPVPGHFIGALDADYLEDFNWKFEPTTGAYEVKPENIRRNQSITLTRVPNWWASDKKFFRRRFNPNAIQVTLHLQSNQSWAAFQKGELDLQGLSLPDAWHSQLGDDHDLVKRGLIHKVQFFNDIPRPTWALRINSSKPLLNQPAIRQGLQHAMNFEQVLKKVFRGDYQRMNTVADGYGPQTHPSLKAREWSPLRAQLLFARAGFTKAGPDGILVNEAGQRLSFKLMTPYSKLRNVLEALRDEAKKAGVELNLQVVATTAGWRILDSKMHEIALGALNTSVEMFPRFWEPYHSHNAYAEARNLRFDENGKLKPGLTPKKTTNNFTMTADREIDKLIDQYRATVDPVVKTRLAHQLAAKLHDYAAYIPGWVRPWYRVGHWRWLRFPKDFNVKESRAPTEYHVHWIDQPRKTATMKALENDGAFNSSIKVFEQYKVVKLEQPVQPDDN